MASKKEIFVIPNEIVETEKALENAGFEAYLVGGCVRDLLINKIPKDWDLTTNAKPEEITRLFPKTFYENEYGTVGVVNETAADDTLKVVEVTPYRLESKYTNQRHPDSVTFSNKLEEDLKRRDFTINALAIQIKEKTPTGYKVNIVDLFGGREDLGKKIIRSVGNADDRFSEDALRMLRAIRLTTELNFTIEHETSEAIARNCGSLSRISAERIRDEFTRIILSANPMIGLILSHKLGILPFIIPELGGAIGVAQNQAHAFDVFEHLMRTVQHAADKNWPLEVRLAALLHDIGKPATRIWSPEKNDWTFHGHDMVSAKMATKILSRLRFPKEIIEKVGILVRWHMFFSDTDLITLSSVRRLVKNVGKENIWDLVNVRMCDRIGTGRPKESPYRLRKYKSMIDEVMHDPLSVGMLKINGAKIMSATNLEPGPKIGHILHALLEEVLEDPSKNELDFLEKKALELSKLPEKDLEKLGESAKDKKEAEEEKAIKEIRDKYWVR